jgi:hypothetical protein
MSKFIRKVLRGHAITYPREIYVMRLIKTLYTMSVREITLRKCEESGKYSKENNIYHLSFILKLDSGTKHCNSVRSKLDLIILLSSVKLPD